MDRKTPYRDGALFGVLMAAAARIHAGHMVCANARGYAVMGSNATGLTSLGMATEFVDNSTGSDGDQSILVRKGKAFSFSNNGASPVTQALVGKPCYIADSQSVAAVGDVVAGTVLFIDADGVWVFI